VSETRLYLKEDSRSSDGESGEHDVVDGGDDGSVEQIQCFVQIIHLCDHTDTHHLHTHPSHPLGCQGSTNAAKYTTCDRARLSE
jgi:hypothetical protein